MKGFLVLIRISVFISRVIFKYLSDLLNKMLYIQSNLCFITKTHVDFIALKAICIKLIAHNLVFV